MLTCSPLHYSIFQSSNRPDINFSLIRQIIPKDGGYDLQHLRRFAKPDAIPIHVRDTYFASSSTSASSEVIFLVVAVASIVSRATLLEALQGGSDDPVTLVEGEIPFNAPTSEEQAREWTAKYWPTVYKKSNPFGPHPSIVSRAQEKIAGSVGKWMRLAWDVAAQAQAAEIGEGVGVVIVERSEHGERCLAVAGDARWYKWPRDCGNGNTTAHAVMRAISMVTSKLPSALAVTETDIFHTQPLLPLEKETEEAVNADGYLCHELEIYCTHEPCVMCAMAVVHSRFGRIVFEKRMREGGITADSEQGGLGHGLWWRRELNWTMLGWEYRRDGDEDHGGSVDEDLNA